MNNADYRMSIGDKVARVTFLLFWFFIFFGTSLPFRNAVTDVDDKTTSNIFNQIVFISLFLTSSFSLCCNWRSVKAFFRREVFLFLFLVWCCLSSAWSEFGITSLKRCFQLLTTVTVCLSALLTTRSSVETLKYFKYILLAYISLSVLAIIFIPGAQDPQSLSWRGLATSKNHLGQASAVSAIIWFYSFRLGERREKLLSAVMLTACMVLLVGSMAATSILTMIMIIGIGTVVYICKRIMPGNIARPFSLLFIISFVAICAGCFFFYPDMLRSALLAMNRDPTFTGRTDLWQHIFSQSSEHLITGCGYGGFWVPTNIDVLILYKDFVWLPNQAHMGYLDILNETGIIGLLLLCGMLLLYLWNAGKLASLHFWHWFLIAALIINFQESTLFRPNFLTGTMFLFAYISMYTDLLFQEQLEYESSTQTKFHQQWSEEES